MSRHTKAPLTAGDGRYIALDTNVERRVVLGRNPPQIIWKGLRCYNVFTELISFQYEYSGWIFRVLDGCITEVRDFHVHGAGDCITPWGYSCGVLAFIQGMANAAATGGFRVTITVPVGKPTNTPPPKSKPKPDNQQQPTNLTPLNETLAVNSYRDVAFVDYDAVKTQGEDGSWTVNMFIQSKVDYWLTGLKDGDVLFIGGHPFTVAFSYMGMDEYNAQATSALTTKTRMRTEDGSYIMVTGHQAYVYIIPKDAEAIKIWNSAPKDTGSTSNLKRFDWINRPKVTH